MDTMNDACENEHTETEYEETVVYRGSFKLAAADGLPIGIGGRNLSLEDLRVIDEKGMISTSLLPDILHKRTEENASASCSEAIVVNDRQLFFDGRMYPLTDEQALVMSALIEAKGDWISSSDMRVRRYIVSRPDRVIKRLPEPIKRIIESKPGRGYRLTCFEGGISSP